MKINGKKVVTPDVTIWGIPMILITFPEVTLSENDVCGWANQEVYVEIETSRFLILFS